MLHVACCTLDVVCCSCLLHAACCTPGDVESLAGVYTISFLSVMFLFGVGNIMLKVKRTRLKREVLPTTPRRRRTACNRQQTTGDRQPLACNMQQTTDNRQHANMQHAACKHATCNMQQAACNRHRQSRLRPGARGSRGWQARARAFRASWRKSAPACV